MNFITLSILLQRQFIEHKRIYAIGAVMLFAVLIFMFLLIHQWQDSFAGAVQNGVFIIGLFVSGGIFSSTMFGELSSKQSSIWLLSIPAKHGEKVLLAILLSVPIFLLVYLLIFYLVDIIYLNTLAVGGTSAILDISRNNFYQFFFQYLSFNGLVLLGGVIFNKYSLLKTLLLCVVLFAGLNFLNNGLLGILIPDVSILSSTLFDSFLFSHQGENIKVELMGPGEILTSLFVQLLLPVSLWIAVWLKLKEKEV